MPHEIKVTLTPSQHDQAAHVIGWRLAQMRDDEIDELTLLEVRTALTLAQAYEAFTGDEDETLHWETVVEHKKISESI